MSTPYHVTLKWPAAFDGGPDLMVNLYAASPEELASQVAHVRHLAAQGTFRGFAEEAPTPAPQPEIHYEPEPEYQGDEPAGSHQHAWIASRFGGEFCPKDDPREAAGKCRWVRDDKGVRRKPTKAELDAEKAARR